MKSLKRILLVFCCLSLILSGAGLALVYTQNGQPTLVYNGQDKSLTVLNTKGTDLFPDLKGLMPGDTRTQKISLQMRNLKSTATLYLKAGCTPKPALEPVILSVYAGDQLVSSGPAGGNSALEEGVKLYEFTHDQTISLQVELTIPTQVGNELANVQEHLQWIFTVQEKTCEVTIPPQTGDTTKAWLWWLLLSISASCLIAVSIPHRKKVK